MIKEQYSIANLPKTQKIIECGRAERLHIGPQRHVLIQGSIVADFALGHSRLGKDDLTSSIYSGVRARESPSVVILLVKLFTGVVTIVSIQESMRT